MSDERMPLLDWLDAIPRDASYEIDNMRAIREWALDSLDLGYGPGDKVEFVKAPNTDNGWSTYREALVVGATATVTEIGFNGHWKYWYADIVLDREWATGSGGYGPWWNGPADETPDGMEPPSAYDQEHHPGGRKHTFSMPVKYLRRADEGSDQ
jgi:hypothetical protein